jgi:hypothetical protein
MRRPKNRTKFSDKLKIAWAAAKRDRYIIILAFILGLALHMYVKHERSQKSTVMTQELQYKD